LRTKYKDFEAIDKLFSIRNNGKYFVLNLIGRANLSRIIGIEILTLLPYFPAIMPGLGKVKTGPNELKSN
jgi:hypothetical protein